MVLISVHDGCMPRSPVRLGLAALALVVTSGGIAGCGSEPGGSGTPEDPLQVVASFYPLQWMAERVGGDRVAVSSLTKPGAEPHDLELTPRNVGAIQDADAVAFLSELQPAVDEAIVDATGEVFDAREAADLVPLDPEQRADAHDLEEAGHDEGDGHDHSDDYEVGATDPHFWLDPTRMASVAIAFGETLAVADPAHADQYRDNARSVGDDLAQLDRELRDGLADCQRPELVTSHQAFGYLADRYGFEQVGIAGISPDADPSPTELAAVADFVEEHDVATIYFETLASPAVARALAQETGAETAVLDPLEGLTDASKGSDYLEVMRSNLATLRAGQDCS